MNDQTFLMISNKIIYLCDLNIPKIFDFWALKIHKILGHVKTLSFYGCETCFTNTEKLYKNFRVFVKSLRDFPQIKDINLINYLNFACLKSYVIQCKINMFNLVIINS